LTQFQQWVAEGRIHYFISGSVGRSNGGSSDAGRIATWVEANFDRVIDGSISLYDLTS
jgi:hypothetical protein